MKPAILNGDLITYTFSAGTASPLTTVVLVTSSSDLTVTNIKVAVGQDILDTPALDVTYQTPVASIPGTAQITVDEWPDLALKTTKNGEQIAISDGTEVGVATLSPVVPAQIPGSPNTPDPITSYPCTFNITTSQTVLNSN